MIRIRGDRKSHYSSRNTETYENRYAIVWIPRDRFPIKPFIAIREENTIYLIDAETRAQIGRRDYLTKPSKSEVLEYLQLVTGASPMDVFSALRTLGGRITEQDKLEIETDPHSVSVFDHAYRGSARLLRIEDSSWRDPTGE